MQPLALIWGESLVGSGHARIQSELSRALEKQGWEVCLITSSREKTQGFDFGRAQIFWQPPLHLSHPAADPYKMSNLMTPNGVSLLEDLDYQHQRQVFLMDLFDRLQPRAVITEMWPFARANFDFELIPLAEKIIRLQSQACSLFSIARDIMYPPSQSCPDSTQARQDRHEIAGKYFRDGHILVRGDENLIPLDQSVGFLAEEIRSRVAYVGYFAQAGGGLSQRDSDRSGDVLVTSGGGVTAESLEMFEACIRIKPCSHLAHKIWRLLIPKSCPIEARERLEQLAATSSNLIIEENRPDFNELLRTAALIICHGGNTVIEALAYQVPALVVPREYAKNNREQQIRANALANQGHLVTMNVAELWDSEVFASLIHQACQFSRRESVIRLDGAEVAARQITDHTLRHAPINRARSEYLDECELRLLAEVALLQPG